MKRLPYLKEALKYVAKKPSTELYPFVQKEAPEGYRGRLAYHPELCINCGLCQRVCSPGAISRDIQKTDEGDRITFTINLDSCTYCSMCADFCSRHAIELTRDYHIVGTKPEDFIVSGTFVKKPVQKPAPKPAVPANEAEKKD